MVKIVDVAKAAGVSVATVSRVLNNNPTVAAEYVPRVLAAVEQLGYRPNGIARNLRRQSTEVIALIISDVANPFFTAITRGVEDVAQRNGYSVLLCNSDEQAAKEATYLRVVGQQQVAGVLISPHSSDTDVDVLRAAGTPIVVIDRPLGDELDSVTSSSFEGARAATTHLLDEGWSTPACITGPADASTAQQRLDGYRLAMSERRLDDTRFVHAPFEQKGGMDAAARLLDSPMPPDALFVANAQMALGVFAELKRRGLQMGSDVGVVTFDDAPWAPFIDPPMSVVVQPAYEIGARAAELLMERVLTASTRESRHEVLATSLLVRESSRRR